MKITGFFKLVFLLFGIIFAKNLISQEEMQDPRIARADSLMETEQYAAAKVIYTELFNSTEKLISNYKDLAEYADQIGFCCYQLNKYNEAIEWFTRSGELFKETGDREALANELNNIGLNYKILGNYEKALEFYNETIKIDEELGHQNDIAITYNNIGMIYRAWGKYDKSIEYFQKSYLIKKENNDIPAMSTSLNNIGLVFSEWKKYDQALVVLRESLAIEVAGNNENEISRRLNNIGRVFFFRQEFDSARIYFEKSLSYTKKHNDLNMTALVTNNLGKVYLEMKDYDRAKEYFTSALNIFSELGMTSEKGTVLANLGTISWAEGRHQEALQLLDSSTAIAENLQNSNQLKQNYLYYSTMFSESKDFEKSLAYYKKYTALKDTIFTKEIFGQLSEFQVKYEKEKDQAHILALEKENLQKTTQRNAYMFTGLGVIVMALFIIFYFRQRALHIKMMAEQKILQLEEEKKLMSAKLIVEGQEEERKRIATELHDGLGVLLSATKMQFSIIRDKSPENKELIEKATRMLEQASGDVRKISHNMMPGLLTKLGFYEAIQDLFEHIDDTHELNATCTITGNIERLAENKEIMLYRIVQEMVNNTIKYARATNITLNILNNQGIMLLKYTDDGMGFDLAEKLESKSIGLKSIQSRVNFLNGKIDIDTEPGKGVKYILQIPT